jgi:rhamnose utilization protein RhaD (predicted bifunctional aldolase and dehydrogenase)
MSTASNCIEKQVKAFCAQIGADPLLVQGAGGNVSWKDGDVLWVKASGMWLAEAESKEIFVPVNLAHLQDALAKRDFSVKPELNSNSGLRPSIETLLHALMPHRVVVHLHAVEILAHLVRINARQKIQDIVGDAVKWIFVDYFKPGADLARAVFEELKNRPDADVVFMGNHGVLLGGASAAELETLLCDLIATCQHGLREEFLHQDPIALPLPLNRSNAYSLLADIQLQRLALAPALYHKLSSDWVLYPDHAVFLGHQAVCYNDTQSFLQDPLIASADSPRLVFVRGAGVYVTSAFSQAQHVQLRCYYEVLRRQPEHVQLKPLASMEVTALLNWDAEKYRMGLTEKQSAKPGS